MSSDDIDRIEAGMSRRADDTWKESDHPRDKDGKFASGAGGGGAKLSESMKPDPSKYNKQRAEYIKKKLIEVDNALKSADPVAALKSIEVKGGHGKTKAYINQLAKEHEEEQAAALADEPEPAPAPEPLKPQPLPVNEKLQSEKADIEKWYGSMLKVNKEKVEAKMAEINNAIASGDTAMLKSVAPIPGGGAASVIATNKYLASLKTEHGVGEAPEHKSAIQSFAHQEAVKVAAIAIGKAPARRIKQVSYHEDANGNEIEATLDLDTKSIPHGMYDKCTAAFKGKDEATSSSDNKLMQEYHDKVWSSIPGKGSLQSYQGSAYMDINKGLAKPPPGENALSQIKAIDKAMRVAKTPADLPVFRGIRGSLKDITGFDDPEQAVGRCFEHTAYASVSRRKQTSKGFAGGGHGPGVLLKFNLPAGAPGVVMPEQEYFEYEILLDRNSVFKIDKVETEGKMHIVHVTYLGHNKSEKTLNG